MKFSHLAGLKEYEEWMRLEGTRNKKTDKKRSE